MNIILIISSSGPSIGIQASRTSIFKGILAIIFIITYCLAYFYIYIAIINLNSYGSGSS